ncbi:hypothetical protein NJ7G_4240 [Natrinema sp. J7-2]|nr:hypothetical protein NJ7G_4240 [Natrinema sp. J7-2]
MNVSERNRQTASRGRVQDAGRYPLALADHERGFEGVAMLRRTASPSTG